VPIAVRRIVVSKATLDRLHVAAFTLMLKVKSVVSDFDPNSEMSKEL
jgi:hypothetical protein